MCHTNLQLAAHYTHTQSGNVSHTKTHILNRDYRTHHPLWYYACLVHVLSVVCAAVCCVCVCPLAIKCRRLSERMSMSSKMYFKPNQRQTRRTVGNRQIGMWSRRWMRQPRAFPVHSHTKLTRQGKSKSFPFLTYINSCVCVLCFKNMHSPSRRHTTHSSASVFYSLAQNHLLHYG